MRYRKEIDGLRAIAVIPVILFHAGFETFSGGFTGVDVFFVISGYLITNILYGKISGGNFSIIEFYERRARRILPALFTVMFFCIPFAFILMPLEEIKSFCKSLIAVPTFLSNVFFWRDVSYFENTADYKPLLHTWSLAVEEQYYFVFPIFLMFIYRFFRKQMLLSICSLIMLSLGTAQWASLHYPRAGFFLLPTRGWELLIGAAAAISSIKFENQIKNKLIKNILGWCGLMLVLYSIFYYNKSTPAPSFYTIVPTVGALLIIIFGHNDTSVGRFLGNNVLVGVGLISYSLYLWHQPLLVFARYSKQDLGFFDKSLVLAFILLMSYISWRFIEKPCREKWFLNKINLLRMAIGLSFLFVLVGCLGWRGLKRIKPENEMAKRLISSPAIYSGNINERKFVKSIINESSEDPEMLIVGSSRVMSIGKHNARKNVLNLSMSGASLEDIVAVSGVSLNKFKPRWLVIGCDPWIFNKKSEQVRWLDLKGEYLNSLDWINSKDSFVFPPLRDQIEGVDVFTDFFFNINTFNDARISDGVSFFDKKRNDGSIVYGHSTQNKSPVDVEKEVEPFMYYSMKDFDFSKDNQDVFEKFIRKVASIKTGVILFLSPYHPKLYAIIKTSNKNFLETENLIRIIAKKHGVKVLGSYDPLECGCNGNEFFDGMHPKDGCMEKIIQLIDR